MLGAAVIAVVAAADPATATPAVPMPRPKVTNVAPASGPPAGGNRVLITGSGFTKVTRVLFGPARSATITVSSPTSIVAVAPKHAGGRVDVRVVTDHGRSSVVGDAARYIYVAPPRSLQLSRPRTIDRNGVTALSCPSAQFCAALDTGGSAAMYINGKWHAPILVDPTGEDVTALSCSSASFCIAMDPYGPALRWNGKQWSRPTKIHFLPTSVSCVSAHFCLAVSSTGESSSFNGAVWTTPKLIGPDFADWHSVSCASASFCDAVGDGGFRAPGIVAQYRNGTWQRVQTIDHDNPLWVVSCPTTRFCAVATNNGVRESTGSAWSRTIQMPDRRPGESAKIFTLGCTSRTFCLAFWQSGGGGTKKVKHLVRLNGAAAAQQRVAKPPKHSFPRQMSCWASYNCRLVGGANVWQST
jgi:hypothetical protein